MEDEKYETTFICTRLLLIITDRSTDKQIHQLFTEAEQPIYYQFRAQGTANTEILDICGLEGSMRVITAALVPKPEIGELFILLENMFEIRKRGKGIALTLPITGIQASTWGPPVKSRRRSQKHI